MSLLKRAGDLVYTFRFLKLLVTKFEDTEAYKLGIIDKNGKRNKEVKLNTAELKSAYTPFHRLVFNIKKLMAKVPGGSSTLASYGAALFLLKEKYGLKDSHLEKINEQLGVDTLDMLVENAGWFVLEDKMLSPGIYRVKNEKVINLNCEEVVNAKDQVKVMKESAYPVGEIFGMDVYEALHVRTNQKVYVTIGELIK
jgi:hypothetical protein